MDEALKELKMVMLAATVSAVSKMESEAAIFT
jgi:hypothetical protein